MAWTARVAGVTVTPELRLRYDATGPGDIASWHPVSVVGMSSIGFEPGGGVAGTR